MPEYCLNRNRYSLAGMEGAKGPPTGSGTGGARSGVGLWSYRAGEACRDPLTGVLYDDRSKSEVAHVELILPPGVSERCRILFVADPPLLFASADEFENETIRNRHSKAGALRTPGGRRQKTPDGEYVLSDRAKDLIEGRIRSTGRYVDDIDALPLELGREACIDIGRAIAGAFADHGEIGMWALHDKPGNQHLHLLRAERGFEGDEFTSAKLPWNAKRKSIGPLDLAFHRRLLADIANRELAKAGYDVRIDHRSFEDQRIALAPTKHEGPGFHALGTSKAAQVNSAVRASNAKKLLRQPDVILQELATERHALTMEAVKDALRKRMPTVGEDWLSATASSLLRDGAIKRIGAAEDGTDLHLVASMAQMRETLHDTARSLSIAAKTTHPHAASPFLRGPDAAIVLMDPFQSRQDALGRAVEEWKARPGAEAFALAPTPSTARTIGEELGIEARAFGDIAPRPMRRFPLPSMDAFIRNGSLVIIDEAECADLYTMHRLVQRALDGGCRLLLVSDPAAMGGHDAGFALRSIASVLPIHDLTPARGADWLAKAERAARQGKTVDLIMAIHGQNPIGLFDTEEIAARCVDFLETAAKDSKTALVATATTAQADRINALLRDRLRGAQDKPGRTADVPGIPDKAAAKERTHDPRYAKPGVGRIGSAPPPWARNRVRDLSAIDLAGGWNGSEVLLPGDVRLDLDDGKAGPDHGLRRDEPRSKLIGEIPVLIERPGRQLAPLPVLPGDRVLLADPFRSKEGGAYVRPNAIGTVIGATSDTIRLRLDDGRIVAADTTRPLRIEYAWALGAHRAKEVSIDRTLLALLDRGLDRQTTARLLTRAREDACLVADRAVFEGIVAVKDALARDGSRTRSPEKELATKRGKGAKLVTAFLDKSREAEKIRSDVWSRQDDPTLDPEWPLLRGVQEELRDIARTLCTDKRDHRGTASALGADWGEIERAAERPTTARTGSSEALRKRHPTLSETEIARMRLAAQQLVRAGIDAESAGLADRLLTTAAEHRDLYARIRAEQGRKPSKEHREWPYCERLREGRDRMATAVQKDPATFRPLLLANGRRWRDVQRWAQADQERRIRGQWRDGIHSEAAKDLQSFAQAREDESFERARRGQPQPHRSRKGEAAGAIVASDTPLLRRSREIGIDAGSVQRAAKEAKIAKAIDAWRQARASGQPAAPALAWDIAHLAGPKSRFEDRAHILLEAASFERWMPEQERRVLASFDDKSPSAEAERSRAIRRWTADPVAMAWIERMEPGRHAEITARGQAMDRPNDFGRGR